mmetsp:Transcript_31562/g.66757  ORF Transcript_31562/g.66757 Transcript_31562/m.66757 type:complete len:136 (+) Transcript_31562:85-492(+)
MRVMLVLLSLVAGVAMQVDREGEVLVHEGDTREVLTEVPSDSAAVALEVAGEESCADSPQCESLTRDHGRCNRQTFAACRQSCGLCHIVIDRADTSSVSAPSVSTPRDREYIPSSSASGSASRDVVVAAVRGVRG